jgi:hypothetical protein
MQSSNKPSFSRSIDTKIIIDKLLTMQIGDTITYQELTDLIKRDVTKSGRGALRSAVRILLNENGMLFGTVLKTGIKRLTPSEGVGFASDSISRIHREAGRGARRIAAVDYEKLGANDRMKHNATAAVLSAMHESTTSSRVRKIEAAVENKHKLAVAETLAMLGGK